MSTETTTESTSRAVASREKGITSKSKGERDKEMYIIWRSIPAMLKILPRDDQKRMGYEVDDPMFQKMVAIKTKTEFCTEFGVGINQPAIWERDPETVERINKVAVQDHVMRFRKDVDFSFTQKVLRHGDAHRMKLWKQLYEGWTEKTETKNTNVNFDMVEIVKAIEERNAKIRGH